MHVRICDSICGVGMEPICCSGVKNKWDSLKIALKMLYPLPSYKLRGGGNCVHHYFKIMGVGSGMVCYASLCFLKSSLHSSQYKKVNTV